MKKEKLKIFKNKFLLIVFIAILIMNIFLTNVSFGATYDLSDYKNVVGSNRWCIVYSIDEDKIYLVMTSCAYLGFEGLAWSGTDSTSWYYGRMGGITVYSYNIETSKFDYLNSYSYQTWDCGSNLEFIACNQDVIKPVGTDTVSVVFQKTPVPLQVVIKPTLMETITQALEEMIQKIVANLKTIMTVGLVVLSIGLVILLVKSVILQMT